MKFHFRLSVLSFFALFYSHSVVANSYSVRVLDDIAQIQDSAPTKAMPTFELGQRVYAVSTITVNKKKAQPKHLSVKWYRCGSMVRERQLVLQSHVGRNDGQYLHHAWFWIKTDVFGAGQYRAELFADNKRVGGSQFLVSDYQGNLVACSNSLNRVDQVLFKYGKSDIKYSFLNDRAGHADELVNSLFRRFAQIRRIEVMGYSDPQELLRFGKGLSLKRAQTVKSILVARGIHASKITILGMDSKVQSTDCVAGVSNIDRQYCTTGKRRVELRIDGDLK